MKPQYYTPQIEEFHYGFEFEANYTNGGWANEVFGIGEKAITGIPQLLVQFLENKGMEGNIRVKYLDQTDIESLGWKCDTFSRDFLVFHHTDNYYGLSLSIDDANKIEIKADYKTVFVGKIKNKSELKKLMQQLQICQL